MSLFKTDSERELWIKLNAERQIEWEKGLTYFDKETQTYKSHFESWEKHQNEKFNW